MDVKIEASVFTFLRFVVPIIILCLSSCHPAKAGAYFSGNNLYDYCSSDAQGYENTCTAYIVGVTDAFLQVGLISLIPNGRNKICFGKDILPEQLVDITKIYL
jgi:hypothetical protein